MKIVFYLFTIIGWSFAVNITNSTETIYGYLSSQSNFSTITSYLESAPALKRAVSSNATNITFFAPTSYFVFLYYILIILDDAISLLPTWIAETLNSTVLSSFFLAYHMTNDSWSVPTSPTNASLNSFLDTNITISVLNDTFALANNKSQIQGIVSASNGYILPIDHILSMNQSVASCKACK